MHIPYVSVVEVSRVQVKFKYKSKPMFFSTDDNADFSMNKSEYSVTITYLRHGIQVNLRSLITVIYDVLFA